MRSTTDAAADSTRFLTHPGSIEETYFIVRPCSFGVIVAGLLEN